MKLTSIPRRLLSFSGLHHLSSPLNAAALFGALLIFSSFGHIMQSTNAQSPPVPPPPAPSVEGANEEDIREPAGAANDKSAPVIEVLTQKLTEGKNLIRAKVSDDSNLVSVKVKYAHDGFIKSSDLVLEQDTTFKGLVSVMAPSAILVFEAVDAEGNMAQTSKWFEVDQVQKNFIEQFLDWLRSLFS